eukprot:TRINITY_DN17701_c0_g1_i1.p1 TRINITY_DN17701_c0_g1~~TRINITY_DN17701_c0_g1_i1.p1  ORF type:complete len:145 (-),score=54.24 TRINITY_DN17701_c0_g1_i1:376-810(-)
MDAITEKQISRAFDLIDSNKDGSLNQSELALFLQVLGHNPSHAEISKLPANADFNAAWRIHEDTSHNRSSAKEMQATLELWDKHKTGTVDFSELSNALKVFGGASQQDIDNLKRDLKVQGNDFKYSSFIELMQTAEFIDPEKLK